MQLDCKILSAKGGPRSTLHVMVARPCCQLRQMGTMAPQDTTLGGIQGDPRGVSTGQERKVARKKEMTHKEAT